VGREISGVARVWVLFFFSRALHSVFTLLRCLFIGVLSFFKLGFSVQKTMEFCIRREF
jgi:hypothetical protein